MQRITVTLTPEVYERLRRQAKTQRRSISAQAGFLLEAEVLVRESLLESGPPPSQEIARCDRPAPVAVP
jgi:hypothetical protein